MILYVAIYGMTVHVCMIDDYIKLCALQSIAGIYTAPLVVTVLVMVSSELVVLLIVCVGINTGSTQGEIYL